MQNNSNTLERCPAVKGHEQTANQPGKGKWTKLAKLAFIGIMAASLPGCDPGEYTGGGFIDSAAGGNTKAVFGFNLEAVDQDGDGQIDFVEEPLIDPDTGEVWGFFVWWVAKGQFNYNDQGVGVQFHVDLDVTLASDGPMNVDSSLGFTVEEPTTFPFDPADLVTGMEFYGTYTSKAGDGRVAVAVHAKGDQFDSAEDTLEVTLTGGPYDGYHNSGTIKGGNIQWHPAKSK